jgi:quercetin dioxygenase-like cupin family protein
MPAAHRPKKKSAFPAEGADGQAPGQGRRLAGRDNEELRMKTLLIATAVALLAAPAAFAGDCPAGKEVAGSMTADGHTEGKGVTDTVLAVNSLGDYYPELADREQRIRKLTIEPGGEVPWHSHADRPALIYVVSGEIVEHRSTCAVPIVHRAGEVAAELGPLMHWWKNETDRPVVLISADLPRSEDKHDGMM